MREIQQKVQTIREELQDHPGDADLLNELGVGYHLLGDYEQAVKFLQKAAAQPPKNHTVQFNLANSHLALDHPERAKHYYMNALEYKADYVPALNNLADLYEQTGDVEQAEELFAYITDINPEDAMGYFNLGNFYLRQNDTVRAGKQYQKTIDLDPDFYEAYHNIGLILKHLEKYKEAIPYYEQCLEINPSYEAAQRDLKICEHKVEADT